MTGLDILLAEQAQFKEACDKARAALAAANAAYSAGSRRLTDALIAAGGWHIGQVVKLQGGGEAKIDYIRLTDDATLTAVCHDRTKSGQWSQRSRRLVKLTLKEKA
jgi:hypothetical protein